MATEEAASPEAEPRQAAPEPLPVEASLTQPAVEEAAQMRRARQVPVPATLLEGSRAERSVATAAQSTVVAVWLQSPSEEEVVVEVALAVAVVAVGRPERFLESVEPREARRAGQVLEPAGAVAQPAGALARRRGLSVSA